MEMKYLYELFEGMPRQGPGDSASTKKAFGAITDIKDTPKILDIGCGSGASTIELAKLSKGKIIALDNHQAFLDKLEQKAKEAGFEDRIEVTNQDMLKMDFAPESFDIIWSEGALYSMGFLNGVKKCKELLKTGRYLAVSELVWLSPEQPKELKDYLEAEYPDIKSIEDNLKQIEDTGFKVVSHFTLPKFAWSENYFAHMEKRLAELRQKYPDNTEANETFDGFQVEIDNYNKFSDFFGYEFFVMKK